MKKISLVLFLLFLSVAGFSQSLSWSSFNPRQNDGLFLRNSSTGQIFLIMEGQARYIQTVETLNGLFVNAHNKIIDVTPGVMATYPAGPNVSTDSGFVRLTYTPGQKVYLREGRFIRWVTTIQVANLYSFNLNIAVNVPNQTEFNTTGLMFQADIVN